MVEHRGRHHRLFPIDAAPGRHAVPPMGVDQPVPGHLPQPKMKWHRRMGQILLQPPMGVEQHILHDVAGIDPAADYAIHPQIDHPPQRRAMALQQPIHGRRIAAAGFGEKFLRFVGVGPHITV